MSRRQQSGQVAAVQGPTGRMLIATVPELPGRQYRILGCVQATGIAAGPGDPLNTALGVLEREAVKLGADAVIGVQMAVHNMKAWLIYRHVLLLGTAIAFTDVQPRP